MNTPFPLHPGKHHLPAVTDPGEHAAYVRTRTLGATLAGLDAVVLIYQRTLLTHITTHYATRPLEGWVRGDLHVLDNGSGRRIGACGGFGPGAPAAALIVEQLIALGTRRIITLGTAAALHPDLGPGDAVLGDSALRDEGLSHHYLPPGRTARPSAGLTGHLARTLRARGIAVRRGPVWSTDAPYRETAAEVARYAAEGILLADMEAAAVFAVAEHRNVQAAALFTVADSLVDRRPRTDSPATTATLHNLFGALLDTTLTGPEPATPDLSQTLR
ncbi:nucleoside phosphorylase [Streptomyces sp. SID1121]|uniref:nucleoside phosphorylase n=1 Tax=Streptomyces sp. SID1121 TaxID=3425888 RepID=UPI004056CDF2